VAPWRVRTCPYADMALTVGTQDGSSDRRPSDSASACVQPRDSPQPQKNSGPIPRPRARHRPRPAASPDQAARTAGTARAGRIDRGPREKARREQGFFALIRSRAEGGQSRLTSQARAICAGCQVQGESLEFALRNPDETEFGVWGGTTPGQRRRLRGRSRKEGSGFATRSLTWLAVRCLAHVSCDRGCSDPFRKESQ
jgi:hypothetical protein